jgi:mycofactocin precursor
MTVTTDNDLATTVAAGPAPTMERTGPGHPESPDADLVEEELLVEDVSIDGMCGVY